jgi:hypothetical protein
MQNAVMAMPIIGIVRYLSGLARAGGGAAGGAGGVRGLGCSVSSCGNLSEQWSTCSLEEPYEA